MRLVSLFPLRQFRPDFGGINVIDREFAILILLLLSVLGTCFKRCWGQFGPPEDRVGRSNDRICLQVVAHFNPGLLVLDSKDRR